MPPKRKRCIVPGCTSHLETNDCVSLHIFPNDKLMKDQWIEGIKTSSWIPDVKKHSRICSNHFDKKKQIGNKIYILPNSIPNNTICDTIIEEEPMMIELEICNVIEPSTSQLYIKKHEIKKRNKIPPINIPNKVLLSSSSSVSSTTSTLSFISSNKTSVITKKRLEKEKAKQLRCLCKAKIKQVYALNKQISKQKKKIAGIQCLLNMLERQKLITVQGSKIITEFLRTK